ncbi:A/G-specific adenine glycosylase [Brevibacterium sp. HMSC07C04]|uniref:A/G-specific adenine glycosylase n=1 Tax=Brevibacterium sp. HMSC07C04 TaxID=1581130 RepID=UPI0008A3D8D3|nr:A/G-specific adenine glycosylase [Brevibacterium sp. HMSC07C04]
MSVRRHTASVRGTHRRPDDLEALHTAVIDWFARHERPLPWRRPGTSAWGVLVSEVMSQQTPMSRVAPRWTEWMRKWPTPADLASASTADVLLAWDTLGYPRRALRLQECARVIVADHGGQVPNDEDTLLSLPGIGAYTAAAVAGFAFGARTAILDVNIRRVLARAVDGHEHPGSATKAEAAWARELLPQEPQQSVRWNAGTMELGALVCTSRSPRCEDCPLLSSCAWVLAGKPSSPERKPKTQAWHGTDRQLRGAIMGLLRTAHGCPVRADLLVADTVDFDVDANLVLPTEVQDGIAKVRRLADGTRVSRLIDDLEADGLLCRQPPEQPGAHNGSVLTLPQGQTRSDR